MAKMKKNIKSQLKENFQYCSQPEVIERTFDPGINEDRLRLILTNDKKWVNGTVLHYYFFDKSTDGKKIFQSNGTSRFVTWTTSKKEKDVVRKAFKTWKDLGIGLKFEEVSTRDDAEIRIGFMRGNGAWSYLGRDVLNQGRDERTMNFGWDLTRRPSEFDTAIHEIGHTLGFPHEHQNPNAGIVWDEEAVYDSLSKPPNRWNRAKTYHNIIRKIDPDDVQGSNWDPNSIMHYPFGAGMILKPEQYKSGLNPEDGLSNRDKKWVKTFYPPLKKNDIVELEPFQSHKLNIAPGEQMNFTIKPDSTRVYKFGTFGISDTVMVLFEDVSGDLRYITADDDSGQDYNAKFKVKLFKDRKYFLRIRLYYAEKSGETAVMMW